MKYEILNIFEKPTLLLIISIAVWMIITLIALARGMQQRRWRLLLPLLLVLLAFSVDYFVKTDREKINSLITTLTKSLAVENIEQIDVLVSEDYSDIANSSKQQLMEFCTSRLARNPIKKINRRYYDIKITGQTAIVDLQIVIILDPNSQYAMAGSRLITDTKLYLEISSDKTWKIVRSDISKVNNYAVSWRTIR